MIKLDIQSYCNNCLCFEPMVVCRPGVHFCYGTECNYVGDTIVQCKSRTKCQHLYETIMEHKNKEDM